MGEGLGVVLRGFEKKSIFGVPECPCKIDLEAQDLRKRYRRIMANDYEKYIEDNQKLMLVFS